MILPGIASVVLALTPASVAAPAMLGVDAGSIPAAYPNRGRVAGVYVRRVVPNSPAEAARILPGDVIVGIAGTPVANENDFRTKTATLAVGNTVAVAIDRYGRTLELEVAPVAIDALYPKEPSCEPDFTTAELGEAGVSARRRDFENERMHGARALDSAQTCTWLHARLDAQTLIDSGDAFAAIAHGAAGETERDLASREYGNAWLAYHLVTTSPGMTADYRSAATAKERALEKRFPGVAGHGDGAIVDGFTYAGAALGTDAFHVMDTWTTSGQSFTRLLHLRVNIETARDAILFANFFRVSVPTPDGPDEVFFATDEPAKPGPRVHLFPGSTSVRTELAATEDLSVLKHVPAIAQTPETYVLTFVISDDKADLDNIASTLAYAPQ